MDEFSHAFDVHASCITLAGGGWTASFEASGKKVTKIFDTEQEAIGFVADRMMVYACELQRKAVDLGRKAQVEEAAKRGFNS